MTAAGPPVRRHLGVAIKPLLLIALLIAPAPVVASSTIIARVSVDTRVLDAGTDGIRDAATVSVVLNRSAALAIDVITMTGGPVRTLVSAAVLPAGTWTARWAGLNYRGQLADDAGYRVRVTASDASGTETRYLPITKARAPLYAPNPGAIVIAIDPGHGGRDPGAYRAGLYEKTANLDIALRLRAMLEGAGATVVMARTSDRIANVTGTDWNADGQVGYADELASRIEVANQARAAVFVAVHNNSARSIYARGTATYYWASRTFGAENRILATWVQSRVYMNLRRVGRIGWTAVNHGTGSYPYYVLNDWDPVRRPRAGLMPGILLEGLFVSNAGDRAVLLSSAGRQRIAVGLYEGIARYLELRTFGAAYALAKAPPSTMVEGQPASMAVTVTNTSPKAWPAGNRVSLSVNGWVPYYEGSGRTGMEIASVPLPALAPGASVRVEIPFMAPAWSLLATTGGRGLFHVDVVSGLTRFSKRGAVALQLGFSITPAPPPTPTPTPTPTPLPSPSEEPSIEPSVEPSVAPSVAPSEAPSTEPSSEPPSSPDPSAGPSTSP